MPQLDITTFLSQIFWLLCFFWLFYFISFNTVVPLIVQTLKLRVKRSQSINQSLVSLENEATSVSALYDSFFGKSCNSSYSLVQKSFSDVSSWASLTGKTVGANFSFNSSYVSGLVFSLEQLLFFKKLK